MKANNKPYTKVNTFGEEATLKKCLNQAQLFLGQTFQTMATLMTGMAVGSAQLQLSSVTA